MEFTSFDNAEKYIEDIGGNINIINVGMIIGDPKWPGADIIDYNYYIITKITNKFVMIKELGKSRKDIGSEYGGFQQVAFRLYRQRDNKVKNSWEKPKTKISIDKLWAGNFLIKKQNKKYGFISLNETYGGIEDHGH
jgi:hypothetical protein